MRSLCLQRTFWLISLVTLLVVAVFAPLLSPFDPHFAEPLRQFSAPTPEHWLGLDQLGRDVASRVIWGTRSSLMMALTSTALAMLVGIAVGGAAGVFGRWVERLVMRLVDIFLSLPGLLLALVVVAILGQGRWQVAVAVGLSLAPTYARLVRAAFLSVRQQPYIEAAYALGASRWRVLWWHLLPNAMGQITTMGVVLFAWALTNSAALDFLGLAGSPSEPSWGRMITEGRAYLNLAPWIAIAPGIMLAVSVVTMMSLSRSLPGR